MKRQEILEIIVSNPLAIFTNGNTASGKCSEYPSRFQVVAISHDKSYFHVRGVAINSNDHVIKEDGSLLRDENNAYVRDQRPLAERATIAYGRAQSMPARLILKSALTEASILTNYITKVEAQEKQTADREAIRAQAEADAIELNEMFTALNIININSHRESGLAEVSVWGRITLQLDGDSLTRLVSALKSALVEVGV